jgi:glycosyltransferase involved in cell wall biosynthesis
MNSIHAKRWISNVENDRRELYWWDITSSGKMDLQENVTQITDWKTRKIKYLKGEHFLRKNVRPLYDLIEPILQITIAEKLELLIKEIKPDVIHSFEMQTCSYPIQKVISRHKNISWIYACWGNDLYYFQNIKHHKYKIQQVLKRVNYLQTDCARDITLAKSLGYKGPNLDVIPTGGGFNLNEINTMKLPVYQRKIILVKGYENNFGRAINVLNALTRIKENLCDYEVVVFASHPVVMDYVKRNSLPYKVLSKEALSHFEVLELMGKSLIYIGNNISDGTPNTLLEALIMGAFPIQSNPGGASMELVNKDNGLLIENPDSVLEIKALILKALSGEIDFEKAFNYNEELAKSKLDYYWNRQKINKLYTDLI